MPVPRLPRNSSSGPPRVEIVSATMADAVARSRGMTARDMTLLAYLDRHRVLTAVHVFRLLFNSDDHARHRLTALHARGVLARFRRAVWPGSQPWHYTLGVVGAAVHAAATGAPLPRPAHVTEKIMRLAHSPHTDHLLGVNKFFVALTHHARTHDGAALEQWWPEDTTAEACGGIVRPTATANGPNTAAPWGSSSNTTTAPKPSTPCSANSTNTPNSPAPGSANPSCSASPPPPAPTTSTTPPGAPPATVTVSAATSTTDTSPAKALWRPLTGGAPRRLADLATPHPTGPRLPRPAPHHPLERGVWSTGS